MRLYMFWFIMLVFAVGGGLTLFNIMKLLNTAKVDKKSPVNHDEIMELALLIESEGSNCGFDEKFLIGSTVIQRLKNSEYPKTIYEVIHQENQYHGVNNEQWCYEKTSWDIANWLFREYRKPEKVIFFWRNTQPTPRYIKTVTHKMKYHNFGI